jgi:hypothetical protein
MPPPMTVATLQLTISKFRPIGGVFPITASMVLNPPVSGISIDGKNVTIQLPAGPLQLNFTLNDPDHVLLGVAFASNVMLGSIGRSTFPTILINRTAEGSSMTVTDQNSKDARYDYVILVQSLASGEIGLIDPAIENEPET